MIHFSISMLSLKPCHQLVARELLPRIRLLNNVLLREAGRCFEEESGINLDLSNTHYESMIDSIAENDSSQARIDSQMAMAHTANSVRRFFEENDRLRPGPTVRKILQECARTSTEVHFLAQTALDAPVAPMYKPEPQNLVPLALKIGLQYPEVIVETPSEPISAPVLPRAHATFVVQELITNAVQASPPNKKVQVTVKQCDDGAVFSVTNLGFKPYQDEHTCYGRVNPERLGSKGIGLSITRAVCDIFGHGLEIRSSKQDPLFRTVASALF